HEEILTKTGGFGALRPHRGRSHSAVRAASASTDALERRVAPEAQGLFQFVLRAVLQGDGGGREPLYQPRRHAESLLRRESVGEQFGQIRWVIRGRVGRVE